MAEEMAAYYQTLAGRTGEYLDMIYTAEVTYAQTGR